MKQGNQIIAILSADGWWARYKQEEESYTFDPVACWALTETPSGRRGVRGLVPDDSNGLGFADRWNNFDGYARRAA